MQQLETIIYGKYYHIYNRGINSCDLFKENENYEYFLNLYDKYISPIADTYAWVLMPNHFHLLIRVKEKNEILNLTGFENMSGLKPTYKYFSNLFNAYTKAFNKKYNRHGSLFERAFKRKLINNEKYLKRLILYIHTNPVHHGFCESPLDYPWSSYISCISEKPTKLQRTTIINWFEDVQNFKTSHDQVIEQTAIEKFLEI
ncbi:MAG: transposase [Bacteroidetes bacterium]|nr:transposase [Bacteroidota bacterium]